MRYFFILFSCAVFSMFASYIEVVDQSKLTVLTPSLKNRETAKLRLSNGMQVYLVSDPQADQSAAAIAVQAGSWQDPKEYPGMAHFLEHMLFMGTKPYPDAADFFKYASDHAGSVNAYTAPDRTVYMFSANHDGFNEGLDRFSHFFIDPLFDPKEVSRELFVVDQEHAKNLENDDWRLYMISKEIGNPNHPNARFSTGNSKTLSKIPLSALKNWYKTHYSAHFMHVVIYSNKSLDELKDLVQEKFNPVLNNNKEPFYTNQNLSSENQKKTIVYVKPIKNTQRIYLEWELPKNFAKDKAKTAELLAYALNRGQRHSLQQVLRSDDLIEELSIGIEKVGNHHALFQISIELTEKGIQDTELVIKRCFEAMNEARRSKLPSYLFYEKQTIAKLNYQYQKRTDAFDFVKSHAHRLVDEPLNTYPQNTILANKYDPKKMQRLIEYLTVENAHIYIMAPPEKMNVLLDQKEKWMGSEYTYKALTNKEIAEFSKKSYEATTRTPPPNPFLPSNLALIETKDLSNNEVAVIINDDYGKVFYLKDNEFQTPEISLHIHILSPVLTGTCNSNILAELFTQHIKQRLDPILACASDAHIHAALSPERYRLNFVIEGFSEKIPLFVEEIFKEITHSYPSKQEFLTIKSLLQKAYENFSRELPVMQAIGNMKSILTSDVHNPKIMLKHLEKISYDDYLEFQNNLFKKTYLEGFFAGNLSLKDAEGIYSDIRHFTAQKPFPINEQINRKVLSLSENTGPYLIQSPTKALGYGIILTIDQGAFSFQKRASQEILGQIIHESFFDTLRSKQKTAYIAKAWPIELEKRLFMNFAVQSSTHEPLDLLYRFELFLEDFTTNFSELATEIRFNTIKATQIEKLKTSMKNLSIKSATLDRLAFEYHDLKWLEKRIEGLQKTTFEDFKTYSLTTLSKANTKRLAILVSGTTPNNCFTYQAISLHDFENLGEYTENLPVVTSSE